MEEGTGISLYVLVGIIIFGLFIGISVLFGEGILAKSDGIIACVESFVGGGDGECGSELDLELPEEGAEPDESTSAESLAWFSLSYDEREDLVLKYAESMRRLEGYNENFVKGVLEYPVIYDNNGLIYGVFDSEGNLTDTYELGNVDHIKTDSNNWTTIRVNDERLIPAEFKAKSKMTTYDIYTRYEYYDAELDHYKYYRVYHD